jgi:hypothetical protein
MAKKKFDALEYLKKHQLPHLAGERDRPFLEAQGLFQSRMDPAGLVQAEAGQHVKIPKPRRDPPIMELAQVIGSAAVEDIQKKGKFVFHAAGDTGNPKQSDLGDVVSVMARDYYGPNPPALFFHLGDVCYNLYDEVTRKVIPAPKTGMYKIQFYSPYTDYPGKIIAIPGNHDSNPEEDPKSIDAFQANLCAALPNNPDDLDKLIESTTRTPMYQPGVFFRVDAPFVQILALFSNGGEEAGVIRTHPGAKVGDKQWKFLLDQLAQIKKERDKNPGQRRALIMAMHHPPFSGGGGHSGSVQMLEDLDAAFSQTQIVPDAVLSGHSHNYQRFTRTMNNMPGGGTIEVPFIVAGNGGHAITNLKPKQDGTPVMTPLVGTPAAAHVGNQSLEQYFDGYGHLLITVTRSELKVDLIGTHTNSAKPVDSITLDLARRKITHQTPPFAHPALGEKEKFKAN